MFILMRGRLIAAPTIESAISDFLHSFNEERSYKHAGGNAGRRCQWQRKVPRIFRSRAIGGPSRKQAREWHSRQGGCVHPPIRRWFLCGLLSISRSGRSQLKCHHQTLRPNFLRIHSRLNLRYCLRKNAGLKRLCNRLNMQKKAGKEMNPDRKCEYRQLLLKYVTFLPIRSGKVGGEEKIEKIFSVTT